MKEMILQSNHEGETNRDVMRLGDTDTDLVTGLLSNFGLSLRLVTTGCEIPGSLPLECRNETLHQLNLDGLVCHVH